MKRIILFTCLACFLLMETAAWAQTGKKTLKVMAWNILHGGNDLPDGPDRVIDIIREIDPDLILMVETYGSGPHIAKTLGYHFHLIAPAGTDPDDESINLSIYSKHPFGKRIDTGHPFYLGGREVLIDERKINVFSNWFYYLPWDDAPEQMGKSVDELLAWEAAGKRTEMIQNVLPYLKKYAAAADSIPMILGGDMNSPSHLDWNEETQASHNGLIVPWYATKVLEEIGLRDSFREVHPNPNWHPGITWDVKERVDSHRIDYIFYKGALKPLASTSYMAYIGETIRINHKEITYPSDHGFVVTTFSLK
ncbi:endonuclease/exonuclease/phosphatase family protein [Cyclobacterium jeungdonense]|uniref:Endonuclease/exonuclease/phosphatase family protein n=1 Tax=Cyclobacterium jeungdonense TaxID=708087 RepID=A0ABT8C6E3_9BACT|nr:endonuclease/exonuclease/phosphatase family protein [Cyclobacterium jeungdonense]MDN3688070.1 endonuclease/exonuclease/phosphatase family protein [Cyclobacterium jeungdonense]